ncbi:ATP-dependent helicase [Anoxynatronum buryatiense]|uniref:ATP-dependent DNA helicase PcrA n=1 Tax=Anoxynatronum buryatiense TaxID=489973 RepID=A0AA46AJH9_9CLOT|nr:UvrD-helicase domain-containing protein [Anoxynatronum buryatiense]SMP62644.1 DNA helicase-2 / ATP-dependent DNA helicase PcrA [Anoxynatronum buryatiense]
MSESSWQQTFQRLRSQFIEAQYPHLNEAQREAVIHVKGPSLVLAGAGSGKTTMLVNRIGHLIRFGPVYENETLPVNVTENNVKELEQWMTANAEDLGAPLPLPLSRLLENEGVDPYRILAITFTNKAAREMKERVQKRLQGRYDAMWLSTFHAACARMLRRDIERLGYGRNFVIYDTQDQRILMKECLKDLNVNEKQFAPGMVSGWISKQKDQMLTPEDCLKAAGSDYWNRQMALLYQHYEKKLKSNNALDFDDLILKTLALFKEAPEVLAYYQNRFQYVLVDEFQDTNRPQYLWVKALAGAHGNLCVVGDDDQSIYGWRGADIGNILGFEKDFSNTRTVKLEQNYRSTATILEAANTVVGNNKMRKDKKLFTEGETGELLIYRRCGNEYEEAAYLAGTIRKLLDEGHASSEVAVLYRTHAQSRVLEEALLKQQIPYRIYGGTRFYDRKEIRDILAYLKVIENPSDEINLKRIVNVPRRGIGDKTVEAMETVAAANEVAVFDVLKDPRLLLEAGGRAVKKLTEFTGLLQGWIDLKNSITVTQLTQLIYDETGLVEQLKRENSVESMGRVENLLEFLSLTKEFDETSDEKTLEAFLAGTSLEAAVDGLDESDTGVLLMTLHSAKGLEFPIVFMPGMEENIFPSSMSLNEGNEEEERRLCYVGITRAETKLYLTNARQRTIFGRLSTNPPSRFLEEIPETCLHLEQEESLGSSSAPARKERWDRNRRPGPRMGTAGGFGGSSLTAPPPAIPAVSAGGAASSGGDGHLQAGAQVRHPAFGKGTVVAKEGEVVTIAFPDQGIKKITLGYVSLTIEG